MASGQSDEELIRLMAEARQDSTANEEAWREFYERHTRYLYAVLLRAHGQAMGEARVADIVQETFVRAFQKSSTYRPDDGASDMTSQRRRVRAWLGRIAENLIKDAFRREPQVVFVEDVTEYDLGENVEDADNDCRSYSENLRRLEEALEKLTDREQEVLRATAYWYRPGQRQQRLPNTAMAKLAADLNTSADNIRQIRARAMRTLRKLMDKQ